MTRGRGAEWTPDQDAIVLDYVPKGKTGSASAKLGRTIDAIQRRYLALTTGKVQRKSRSPAGMSEHQMRRIKEGLAQKKANQG